MHSLRNTWLPVCRPNVSTSPPFSVQQLFAVFAHGRLPRSALEFLPARPFISPFNLQYLLSIVSIIHYHVPYLANCHSIFKIPGKNGYVATCHHGKKIFWHETRSPGCPFRFQVGFQVCLLRGGSASANIQQCVKIFFTHWVQGARV